MESSDFALEQSVVTALGYDPDVWKTRTYEDRLFDTTLYLDKEWRNAMKTFDDMEKRKKENESKGRRNRSRSNAKRPRRR